MTGPTRGLIRMVVLAIVCLTTVSLHQAHPEWGYAPLAVWLVLMAIIYGVSLWLWSREAES